ncbi:unnamed protein product [Withania somnifera]
MASSSCYNSPCAACKFLRRKCLSDCIFAPYFPPEEPHKFANVHKIFGASNDAVSTLAYEAEARVRDPVYGCVSAITYLQRQVERLEKELDAANADLMRYVSCNEVSTPFNSTGPHQGSGSSTLHNMSLSRRMGYDHGGGGGGYFPYPPSSWNDQNLSGGGGGNI